MLRTHRGEGPVTLVVDQAADGPAAIAITVCPWALAKMVTPAPMVHSRPLAALPFLILGMVRSPSAGIFKAVSDRGERTAQLQRKAAGCAR